MTSLSPSSSSSRLALLALLSFSSSLFFLYKSRRLRLQKKAKPSLNPNLILNPNPNPNPKLFFASHTGVAKSLALRLSADLRSHGVAFDLVDPQNYEPEDLARETLVLIVASTWEDGKPPPNAEFLSRWLAESVEDFRVGSLLLSKCRFAVFGVGSSAYGERFNAAARGFASSLRALGAKEVVPIVEGDVDGGDVDEAFRAWSAKVVALLKGEVRDEGCRVHPEVKESDEFDESFDDDDEEEEESGLESGVVDMEDIAGRALIDVSYAGSQKGREECIGRGETEE